MSSRLSNLFNLLSQYENVNKIINAEMNVLTSREHKSYGETVTKKALSPFDSKRCLRDGGILTYAFGHKGIKGQ